VRNVVKTFRETVRNVVKTFRETVRNVVKTFGRQRGTPWRRSGR